MMHAEFDALAQGKCDYTLKVIPIANNGETLMTILATEEAVYISKAQAMAFFGLIEPAQLAAPVAQEPAEVEAGNRGLASLEAAMQGERQPGICPACKEHTLSYGHCIYCGHSCAVSA